MEDDNIKLAFQEAMNEIIISGKLITAIKLYRQATGMGLKEAKDEIDSLRAGGYKLSFNKNRQTPSTPGGTVNQNAIDLTTVNNQIAKLSDLINGQEAKFDTIRNIIRGYEKTFEEIKTRLDYVEFNLPENAGGNR